jgi:hypothetical protein
LIIQVLLGEQWVIAGGILGIMSLLFFYYSYLLVFESALTAVGQVKTIFIFDIFSLVVIVATLLSYLQLYDDLNNMIWLRVSLGVGSTLLIGIVLHRIVPLNFIQIGGVLILSAALSAIAIAIANWLSQLVELGPISVFLLSGTVFCLVYAGLLLIILPWLIGTSVRNLLAEYRQIKGD